MAPNKVKIFLVGRSGNGKSSTGNSILDQQIFTTFRPGETEVNNSPEVYSDEDLTIVDGTGLGDTGDDSVGGTTATLASSNLAFKLCNFIFTSLIFVLKYGVRFTKQEKDAVLRIKSLFGEQIFKTHGVILMTYGDNFPSGENYKTFDDWCKQQDGDFRHVLEECNYRCVLFNNRTKEKTVQDKQWRRLLEFIGQLKTPYTMEDYQKASECREKIDPNLLAYQIESRRISDRLRYGIFKTKQECEIALGELQRYLNYLKVLDNKTTLMQHSIDEIRSLIAQLELSMNSLPSADHGFLMRWSVTFYRSAGLNMMAKNGEVINLLLLGRSGNGKSSTGNTIFKDEVFEVKRPNSSPNDEDLTNYRHQSLSRDRKEIQSANVRSTNSLVTLVDGSGICDSGTDLTGGVNTLLEAVQSISEFVSTSGFHAILFVLKYGVRFTKQEKDAVKCVKSMFGEDVFKRWGVIVMTYGDNFEKDHPKKLSFQDWIRDQTGDFRSLFAECNNRCVLFNNIIISDESWLNLRSAIDQIQSPPYSKSNFDACSSSRHEHISKQPPSENTPLIAGVSTAKKYYTTDNSDVPENHPPSYGPCIESSRCTRVTLLVLIVFILGFIILLFMNINWFKCKKYVCDY